MIERIENTQNCDDSWTRTALQKINEIIRAVNALEKTIKALETELGK